MTKRALLLHNAGAGFESCTPERLSEALARKGFTAELCDPHGDTLDEKLQQAHDLVVIAGGDGTVGKVVKRLAGKPVPIGILPLGTANNVATSLGLAGDPEAIIAGWDMHRKTTFDICLAQSEEGEKYFLESVGFGLFPLLIQKHKGHGKQKHDNREDALKDALQHQLRIVREYQGKRCTIELDEETLSGNYLMVEVMNIPLCGPGLCLAPEADYRDGALDIMLVRQEDRETFSRYLSGRLKGKEEAHALTVRRARSVRICWQGEHYHRDDTTHKLPPPITIAMRTFKTVQFLLANNA